MFFSVNHWKSWMKSFPYYEINYFSSKYNWDHWIEKTDGFDTIIQTII